MEEAERVWRKAEAKKAQRDTEAEEAQKMVEVEEARKKAKEEERFQREAKTVQVDAEKKKKKVEVLAAWCKQLELLSQHKVTACIGWEEDIWRVLEAGSEGLQSMILGYGKGKVLEKHVCMNCLRKGIECEWDEGG